MFSTSKAVASAQTSLKRNIPNFVQTTRTITHDEFYGQTRHSLTPMGRAGASGVIATVFGATGFLGANTVAYLAQTGCRVVCPFRGDGMNARKLKVMGDLGQVVPYPISLKDESSLRKVVASSNVVINMIGMNWSTRNFSQHDVNVEIPKLLARISQSEGVPHFIHVSALGASEDAPSQFFSTKALGELAVQSAFPGATIVRPASIFGLQDKFITRLAALATKMPVFPINSKPQYMQPVFVEDVARSFIELVNKKESMGAIYEFAGPETFTLESLLDMISHSTHTDSNVVRTPAQLTALYGAILGLAPRKLRFYTKDEAVRQLTDIVPSGKRNVQTFADLGITDLTRLTDLANALLDPWRIPQHASDD